MTTTRRWIATVATVTAAMIALAGCKKDSKDKPYKSPFQVKPATGQTAPRADVPPGPAGPAVVPVITSSITFVVPKAEGWWGELSFACYAAGATMSSGAAGSPGAPFAALAPTVPDAMAAGDIDLDHDLAAIGGFACGDSPCFYIAANLRHPERMKDVLAALVPGVTPKDLGGGHYSLDTPGMHGIRTINVHVVPIRWPAAGLPTDAWATAAAKATHVIFLGGIDGKNVDVDPLGLVADATGALARVKDTEAVLADAHSRCIIGTAGAGDFKPGYKLDRARFAAAAPEGSGDPLTRLLGSTRSLDVEVELALTPAPRDADITKWIAESRAFLSQISEPVKLQFAAQGPMVDAMLDMFTLIGDRGFVHTTKGNALRLSWRTDRVPQSDLEEVGKRFEALGLGGP